MQIVPARVFQALALMILFLAVAHVAVHLAHERFGGLNRTMRLFELDEEANLPTWFSSITLFTAAMLSAGIALVERSRRPQDTRYWLLLCTGFVYLSVDELAMLHDKFGGTLARVLGVQAHGWLTYVWVVPALIGIGVVGLFLLGFVRRLPRRVLRYSVLAGICYVGGAIGCEMISASLVAAQGESALKSVPYLIEVVVEETLEMSGVAIWIYAQLLYLMESLRSNALNPGVAAKPQPVPVRPAVRWRSLLGRRVAGPVVIATDHG